MKKILTVNWYYYVNFENFHVIELEFVNEKTGASSWKMYQAKTEKEVRTKAKREETRIINRFARVYGSENDF